ncbi:hypothetical protein FACS189487_02210 [Campylobacterota bacterium]|nr:hypothetical protein FACS189487_02210 [Campylobacterota bacterium]
MLSKISSFFTPDSSDENEQAAAAPIIDERSEVRMRFETRLNTFTALTKQFCSEMEKNDDEISEISGYLRQYGAGASVIIEKNRSMANITQKMCEDIDDAKILLENNIRQISVIKNGHDNIIAGIMRLGGQVTKIKDFVRSISAVTDQTKVIAFNAALEAASAGESGKRFSVVSSEINRLTDDVAKITKQIREHIEEIFATSSALIVSSEAGAEQIVLGGKFVSELLESFKNIGNESELVEQECEKTMVMGAEQSEIAEKLKGCVQSLLKLGAANTGARLDKAASDLARLVAELTDEIK